ncbi:hypothetical protein GCM10011583_58970 [Streptomyces camponoticapitis]|uniref:Integral membrane protein n=1 Tax=Streptomyces camponoticapitis TaxID=1616125 RepID=A0ABQ2EPE8_9ACTN|nr:hypothetical protein [Streptomyces camponoticapitis]GGK19325.1 hypothetical protein GCM10011583_58970 [Streptomyces camponoticapitis]
MPGSPQRVVRSVAVTLAAAQAAVFLFASRAIAAPTPTPSPSASDDPCELIAGPARDFCDNGEPGSTSRNSPLNDPTDVVDPLTALARGCAEAAAWTVDTLSKAVKETATVDFTNTTFLSQYAVVFAAATILTLILWLLAVAKRAIRGVPLTTAISEAIGFLWLTVLASAFTPLILYTLVSATDGVTDVIAGGTSGQTDVFFGTFSEALKKDTEIGGGPIMLIVVSLVTILAAGILYLELFIRAILLYVGALLGVVVYAGLVDKNMWGHVRRWAGLMIAVIMVKPVIVIVLGLAGALTSDDGPDSLSAVVSGLAIIILAIFASAMIYRFVPGFGDEIASARSNAKLSTAGGRAAAVISSPAGVVSQGIKTHSGRSGGGGGDSSSGGARPSNPVSGGVAAHSSRPSSGGGGGGGGGSVPSPAPAPRSSSPTSGTPHSSRSNHGNRGTGNNSTGGGGR